MPYIWSDYSKDRYFEMDSSASAYMEVGYGDIIGENREIRVNVFRRFAETFFSEDLITALSEMEEMEETEGTEENDENALDRQMELRALRTAGKLERLYKTDGAYRDIVNIILHAMARLDRIRGVSAEEIKMGLVYKELREGLYGSFVRDNIDRLRDRDLTGVLRMLVKHEESDGRERLFSECLETVFGRFIAYHEKSTGKNLIYIERPVNEYCEVLKKGERTYNETLFCIVLYLFADIGAEVEVFWENEHFGLIGRDFSMKMDQLCIY